LSRFGIDKADLRMDLMLAYRDGLWLESFSDRSASLVGNTEAAIWGIEAEGSSSVFLNWVSRQEIEFSPC